MIENFKINSNEIDKINFINKEDKNFRIENLNAFNSTGFPSKKEEDWKFSDTQAIFSKNFKKLNLDNSNSKETDIKLIKDFDHNYMFLVNGKLVNSEFKFEDKSKIKISNYYEEKFSEKNSKNPFICLNHALSNNGYYLEIKEGYKFEKVLVIYDLFTKDLSSQILNNKNKIVVGKNSELHTVNYTINRSKNKFINNSYESTILFENSKYKNICIQASKSDGYFHKFSNNKLRSDSNFSSFIFSSGLKFYKQDINIDLEGENSECDIKAALFLDNDEHQEIKTKINHLVPNCKSYQKIKNVLDSEGRGIYQGKIYVKDIAQKTNAYQLSKALLLDETSEFNAKPELEIYADDVKCSHGSASGSLNEDSIFYLMSRGLNYKQSKELLINGFMLDVVEKITDLEIKNLIKNMIGLKE